MVFQTCPEMTSRLSTSQLTITSHDRLASVICVGTTCNIRSSLSKPQLTNQYPLIQADPNDETYLILNIIINTTRTEFQSPLIETEPDQNNQQCRILWYHPKIILRKILNDPPKPQLPDDSKRYEMPTKHDKNEQHQVKHPC